MTSLISCPNQYLNSQQIRRSDRKKIKPIAKDKFLLQNSSKKKVKKYTSHNLSLKSSFKTKKIQFSNETSLNRLNLDSSANIIEILKQMKLAVNYQQTKLDNLQSLMGFLDISANCISSHCNEQKYKKNALQITSHEKSQENINSLDLCSDQQFQKDGTGINTAQQLFDQFNAELRFEDDNRSISSDQNVFDMQEIPRMRKQSSKLLSDNYQNQELLYTIHEIEPNWHKDDIQINELHEYLN